MNPDTAIGAIGERALVERLRARIPGGPRVRIGIGDDAALVETGPLTVVTTDVLVEDVHFRRAWGPPRLLGRKALSVNLSDVAAMGGIPRFATVSLALPPDVTIAFVDGLYDGLLERANEAGVTIVGGNLAATRGPIVVDVALMGEPCGAPLLRSGARAGDTAMVTGSLGASACGLRLLMDGARVGDDGGIADAGAHRDVPPAVLRSALLAHLDPAPPLAFARAVGERGLAHAAIDLSDGLSGDLAAVCAASRLSAWIDAARLPAHPAAALLGDASLALDGGEDYQLLLAVPAASEDAIGRLAAECGVALTAIGAFAAGPAQVTLRDGGEERTLLPRSHEHFAPPRGARP